MKIVNAGKPDGKKVSTILNNQEYSKSRKMKELFLLGLEVRDIAEKMGVRYNFVYNVVSNMVRMDDVKVETNKKEGKKDQIIALYKAGKTNTEISQILKSNYQYVYKTVKEYKAANPVTTTEKDTYVVDLVKKSKQVASEGQEAVGE